MAISRRKVSAFNETWYTTAHLELDDSQMKNMKIFKI